METLFSSSEAPWTLRLTSLPGQGVGSLSVHRDNAPLSGKEGTLNHPSHDWRTPHTRHGACLRGTHATGHAGTSTVLKGFTMFTGLFPKQTELENIHQSLKKEALINSETEATNTSGIQLNLCSLKSHHTLIWGPNTTMKKKVPPPHIKTATQCYSQTPAHEGEWWVGHIRSSHLNVEQ
ncbi:hypothetical protein PAMP_023859 [Pampus punctatissimus]